MKKSLLFGTSIFALHCTVFLFGDILYAVNPAMWTFSEATSGEDVEWTSPVPVENYFPRYVSSYEITRIEAFTGFGSSDITDQFDDLSGMQVSDSLPTTLYDESFDEATTGSSATVLIFIDGDGFGQSSITDVVLGSFFSVPITSIEVDGTVTVEGVLPGDFDSDLDVDGSDFLHWQRGGTGNPLSTLDLGDWQDYFNTTLTPPAVLFSAVPEPSVVPTVFMLCFCMVFRRKVARQ